MKTNFKKSLAVFMAVLMLASVFSVTGFAATYTAKILPGSAEGSTLKATLNDGTPITEDMLTITSTSTKAKLPAEAYFERADYIQDGWTTTASGGGTLLKFGSSQTINNKKFYPHWKQVVFSVTFGPGNYYDATDPNNFADASMTQIKEHVMKTDGSENIIFPGAMFTRDGYVQTGWCTAKSNNGTGTKFDFGSEYTKDVTKNINFYPFWEAVGYKVEFVGGAYGQGTPETFEVAHDKAITAPGEIFTREDYTQIGWTTTEDSDIVELELNALTPKITGDVTYYPVWRKNIYAASADVTDIKFGVVCIDYANPGVQNIVVTNDGNATLEFTLPVDDSFNITLVSGELSLAPGRSFTISVEAAPGLAVGVYNKTLVIDCNRPEQAISFNASLKVVEHSFGPYKSNNDATYSADGTKTAECLNKCGTTDTIADPGSMKVYSAENNDAIGIADSYVHHRTVRFTAYGSGMDDKEGVVGKRFVPVTWYVNEEFNGDFESGYEVVFTHTLFGEYTLTINYVEEEYNAETGEWVTTGVTDEKTFEYTVGTTAEEEQEIIRPNTILSIIFGLFAELFKLLGIQL